MAVFRPEFRDDLMWWIRTEPRIARRVMELVEATMTQPAGGIGKPEPLRHLKGVWSRRITSEHRLVYDVSESRIDFLQCRYHYER